MNPRYERWRWITFGVTWLVYASFYFTRQAFSVAKTAMGPDDPSSPLTRQQMGDVDTAFQVTYMVGQFLFGPLGDRFGPRKILLGGALLSVAAAVASGYSTTFLAIALFAVAQGIAQSTGWSNCNKTMSSWFSLRERGRVIGWWCTCYTVGPAVSLPFCGMMMDHFGSTVAGSGGESVSTPFWPAAFWGGAAVVAAVGAIAFVMLRNRPEDVGLPPIEEYHGEPPSLIEGETPTDVAPERSGSLIAEVLASPTIWMLATSYFFVKLARYVFLLWGPMFVKESLGSDASTSAFTAAAMPIGGVFGVIGIGYVSDRVFQSRRAPAAVLSLLATAAIMMIGLTRLESTWGMAAFFFSVGVFLFGPDSVISATASIDFGTKRGSGTATGIVNGIGSIGSILGGWRPGMMTSGSDWTPLFQVLLIGLIVSAFLLAPLWRTKPPTA